MPSRSRDTINMPAKEVVEGVITQMKGSQTTKELHEKRAHWVLPHELKHGCLSGF